MTSFTISLAGIPIRVSALYERTAQFCSDYFCEEDPLVEICITPEDIEQEQIKSDRESLLEGTTPTRYSDTYLESLAVYRKIAAALLSHNILLFHASVMAFRGKAYLFTAPSGTGKTTHSRLWLSEIPGSYVLNGDKPLLRFEQGRVFACGTPWKGKERYGRNEILPLEAICILERDTQNHMETVSFHDALPVLLAQCNRPETAQPMLQTLELVDRLGKAVKLYRLGCNMEPEAARLSFRTMCGGIDPAGTIAQAIPAE